jgi:hypothetical protein
MFWMNKEASWLFGYRVVLSDEANAPAVSLRFDSQENGAFAPL